MSIQSVINIQHESADLSLLQSRKPKVRKIIIGNSPTGNSEATCLEVPELDAFDINFPNLTHLYLWSTTGLQSLPSLPDSLTTLEVRRSLELISLETLPTNLESLVLEDCERLQRLPSLGGQRFERLRELSLVGCAKVPADWIRQLIAAAPHLQTLDLSRCHQIDKLPLQLPAQLDRMDLNECSYLLHLPNPLPLRLRRLGLKGAKKIQRLPPLPKRIDYLDLGFTESLTLLPPLPESNSTANKQVLVDGIVRGTNPRSLFLYGSGLLEPPASEHGSSAETNVATETREYFADLQLVGRGTVRRSKLLFLGNGSAGKTRLALNLNPHYRNHSAAQGGHYRGSTHGIQFWDWPDFAAKSDNDEVPVHLHMWDFGGQEIYHATHRNFIRQGSVFLLLWNPDQDGQQPAQSEEDTWYPLQYWLDLIQLECPHRHPLRAIVCTHQGQRWQELKERRQQELRTLIGEEYADQVPLFILDSADGDGVGQRSELLDWLAQSVYKLVAAQGTAVPCHWEIAQNMVEPWLPKPDGQTPVTTNCVQQAKYKTLSQSDFRSEFHAAIDTQIKSADTVTDFDKLRANYANGAFLTDRRLHRTLRFLTQSGWLYWKEDLEDRRVIVDQRWALCVAYQVLQRKASSIRRKLLEAGGRFTFADLQEWWDGTLDDSDQLLVLSFMTSIGVCFPLSRQFSWEHTSETQVYISPTHLPTSEQLCEDFNRQHPQCAEAIVPHSKLHRGHWFTMLREICRNYGDQATYTRDACVISHSSRYVDRHDCMSLLQFRLVDEKKGMDGSITIRVAGAESEDVLSSLKSFVEAYLPGGSEGGLTKNLLYCESEDTPNIPTEHNEVAMPQSSDAARSAVAPIRVLISYSHDSAEHAARVLTLSDRLREHGVDCRIDQYEPVPSQGWPVWMEEQIVKAKFVLCICTREYAKRFNFEAEAGVGRGVSWEASLIRNALYLTPGANDKFLTAQFDQYSVDAIPACLRQYTNFVISSQDFDGGGYEKLYRHLTGQPLTRPIALGERVVLLDSRGTVAPERVPASQFIKLEESGRLLQSPKDLEAELKSKTNVNTSSVSLCERAKDYLQKYQQFELDAIHNNAPELGSIRSKKAEYERLVKDYCKDAEGNMARCKTCDKLKAEIRRLEAKLADSAGAADQNYYEKEIEKKKELLQDHICTNPS